MPVNYYIDKEKKKIKPELFSEVAEKTAESFRVPDKKRNKYTQIRKFYNDILVIKAKVNEAEKGTRNDVFEQQLPFIKMSIAKVAYAKGRDNVTSNFSSFIKTEIGGIEDLKDFETFCHYFEAVIAFSKTILKD